MKLDDYKLVLVGNQVDTAGAGNIGQSVQIPYLGAATATEISARLYAEAADTSFRW